MVKQFLTAFFFSFAWDLGRYVVAAGTAYLAFRIWGRERFRHRLIQADYAPASSVRRELAYSLSTALVFACTGATLWCGAHAGVFRLYFDVATHGWLYFAFTIALLPVMHDTWFYWTHRAMHHRALFKRVHLVHHLSTSPSPMAAYAFAPLEAIVQAAFVPLVALVMPVHRIALFVFLTFMILRNVYGHLGIELLPRAFIRHPWLRWSTTTTHHDMHHKRMNGNYGLYFTFWDRAMKTMHADYEKTFDRVASKAAPSRERRHDSNDASDEGICAACGARARVSVRMPPTLSSS